MTTIIPFDKYDYLLIKDLERCPYPMFTQACGDWSKEDEKRMLLIALDRYVDRITQWHKYSRS